MRVIYYTHPCFLEPALLLTENLSKRACVDLCMEISPSTKRIPIVDLDFKRDTSGLLPADEVIRSSEDATHIRVTRQLLHGYLALYRTRRTLDPRTYFESRRIIWRMMSFRPDIIHIDDPDMSLRLILG